MAKATLRNRTAVVTGGANGIGRSMARAFAKAELSVAVADVDVDGAEAVASEIRSGGGDAIALTCDVSRFAEVEALAAEVRERLGPVGMLCNNAGIGGGLHPSMDVLDVARMIEDAAGGHIVNTASMAAFLPAAGTGPYTTTKFAVVGLSEVLRAELAPHEIGVSVLCPGPFDTGIWGGDQTSDTGGDPAVLGPRVLAAVEANEPFIFTHPEFAPMVSDRFDRIATRLREAGPAMLRAVTAAG
jgi:NAD(P)-dependent dehydrogenase (short-subunit alcohol dehydrogenase family)